MPVLGVITSPIETACEYLRARYSGVFHVTGFSQAETVLNYVGVPIGGILVASRRRFAAQAAILVVSFIPSLISMLVYADKGTLFLSMGYFYGGVIVGRVSVGNTALVTWRTIVSCAVICVVLLPVLMLVMLNRGGGSCSDSGRTAEIMSAMSNAFSGKEMVTGPTSGAASKRPHGAAVSALEKNQDISKIMPRGREALAFFYLRSYAFSHLYAFSDWFQHYYFDNSKFIYEDPSHPTLGFWTFMAVGQRIDPSYKVPPGYFAEYFYVPKELRSNIFTMFRGLIYDFGLVGSLFFMAFVGGVSAWAYTRMLASQNAFIAQAFYIALAGFVYSSYLLSIGTWASVYLAGAHGLQF